MPIALDQNSTISLYGDSISDFIGFGTYNMSLYRELDGRLRLAENDKLVEDGYVFNDRPGWIAAIAGTTVSGITKRFLELVPHDEADVVVVLMGANGYGSEGPGGGSDQDWRDRADDIVDAAAAAGKILVLVPPVSHHLDPKTGREALKDYLPTLASDTVIVADTSAFQHAVHTNDGVHPNALGGALIAKAVADALADRLAAPEDFATVDAGSGNILANGDFNGSGGILTNASLGYTSGQVADGWMLQRKGIAGTAVAEKAVTADGDQIQRLSYLGKGEARLVQIVALDGQVGEEYEILVHVKVSDPNNLFQGIRLFDSDAGNGTLFQATPIPILQNGGTGSFETILRSAKFTLEADQARAIVNISAFFGLDSGATVELHDVILRKVVETAPPGDDTTTGGSGDDTTTGGGGGDTLTGGGGNDTTTGGGGDTITGGGGNDTLTGGGGNDTTTGGGGDTITGGGGNDTLTGGDGNDSISGGGGNDTLTGGGGSDTLTGGSGNDSLTGGGGNDTLPGDNSEPGHLVNGTAHSDRLHGGTGDDTLIGGSGSDVLFGASGDDILAGGIGIDYLTGGTGADVFRLTSSADRGNFDVIRDFEAGIDKFHLAASIYDILGATLDASEFTVDTRATTAEHRLIYNSFSGALLWDADGRGGQTAVVIAQLQDQPLLSIGDFLL